MSHSLDPDQTRHFVRPDLGPNCLQRLSADDTSIGAELIHFVLIRKIKKQISSRQKLHDQLKDNLAQMVIV